MRKGLRLYDFAMGFALGGGTALLITGHHGTAVVTALIALGLRFTAGRSALEGEKP